MISALLGIVIWVLRLVSYALLIYCVATFIAPKNDLVRKAAGYVEPVLAPCRRLLYKVFPKLQGYALDFSPLVAWLAIDILIWILNRIR